MLILQRKVGQSLIIGDNIRISINEIGTDRVKISIDAPKEIPVLRSELLDAVNNNLEAAKSSNNESITALKKIMNKE